MVKQIDLIKSEHHKETLNLRRLDRLVQSDDFNIAWERSTEKSHNCVLWHIKKRHYKIVKDWVFHYRYFNFQYFSIRDLRNLASKHHIPYYSRLSRPALISALVKKGVSDGIKEDYFDTIGHNAAATNYSRRPQEADPVEAREGPDQDAS